jgi:hypothetical protein
MPLETDKQGGFKYPFGDEMQTGLYQNLFSGKIPLWEVGENVHFTDIGVQKIKGWLEIADTSNGEPIRGITQIVENTSEEIIYAGDLSSLYRVNASDDTLTTVGTGYSLSADSGGSVWDSGASTWDAGTSVWDAGVVQADHWSMETYGSFILATSGADAPQIKKTAGNFTSMVSAVNYIAITDGGTGYAVTDVLTLTGGDGSGATATVLAVSGGVITSVGMTTGGTGWSVVPTGHTSSGASTDATFTFAVSNMDVTSIEVFVKRGPHLLGFNTSVSDREFIWSAADDVDDWVTSTTNLAGQLQIRELDTAIVAAVPLGSRIAVYGTDQMFLVNYLANNLVFGYQPAINGIGAVSKHSVVAVGRKNYGLSEQGFFVTDGVDFEYIDEPAMRNYYQDNVSLGQVAKAVGFHNEEHNQIRWYFPTSSSSITRGVTYNYRKGTWSVVVNDRSAGDERGVLSSPISGSETGKVFRESVGTNAGTTAMTAYVRTKPISLGSAEAVKEMDSVRIGFIGQGLQYRVGWAETEDGTVNWSPYADMSTGFDFQNLRTAGRWLLFELYSASLNAEWEVQAVEFIGRVEGTR